jgi:hypothetical protein
MTTVKKEATKGFLKSLATADISNIFKMFKDKPKRTTIKAALTGTAAEGAIPEIMKQYKEGDLSASAFKDIVTSALKNVKTRGSQLISGAKDIYKDVAENKNMGGMMNSRKKGMGLKMANGGPVGSGLKPVPGDNKGLSKLPQNVRNKMGFMKDGGVVKKRAKSKSKKSRGMGIAKRGGKFKGTF